MLTPITHTWPKHHTSKRPKPNRFLFAFDYAPHLYFYIYHVFSRPLVHAASKVCTVALQRCRICYARPMAKLIRLLLWRSLSHWFMCIQQ